MSDEKFWIAMFKSEDCYYLLGDGDPPSIVGFSSQQEGLDFFTDGYDRAIKRGREGEASAFLARAMSQPRIVEASEDLVMSQLIDESKPSKYGCLGKIVGFQTGILCNRDPEQVRRVYESGVEPPPISEGLLAKLS